MILQILAISIYCESNDIPNKSFGKRATNAEEADPKVDTGFNVNLLFYIHSNPIPANAATMSLHRLLESPKAN
jgi:hypothetical protein